MFQVVVLPPEGSMRAIEEFRRLHDPSFHRIGAHLPLLTPFEARNTELVERFDAFPSRPEFEVALGAPAAAGRALCLPVTTGDAALRALQTDLAASLLGPLHEAPSTALSLRVGFFTGDAEMELARRVLAAAPPPPPFQVRGIALLLEDVRGLWHTVRERHLTLERS